jgi:hypothetical protein
MLCDFYAAKVTIYTYTYKYFYYPNFIFRNIYLVIWIKSNIFAWFL